MQREPLRSMLTVASAWDFSHISPISEVAWILLFVLMDLGTSSAWMDGSITTASLLVCWGSTIQLHLILRSFLRHFDIGERNASLALPETGRSSYGRRVVNLFIWLGIMREPGHCISGLTHARSNGLRIWTPSSPVLRCRSCRRPMLPPISVAFTYVTSLHMRTFTRFLLRTTFDGKEAHLQVAPTGHLWKLTS